MTNEKWQKFLGAVDYPPSLTTEDPLRVKEAEYFVAWATRYWDKSQSLLILGCGDGYEVRAALDQGWQRVKGITWHPREYENVKKQHLEERIVQGDIHEMPFSDGEFDCVISKETLEHLISPYIGLAEINRVMRKEGKFCHLTPEGEQKQSEYYHYHCAPPWMWKDLMEKTGFVVEEIGNAIMQNFYRGYKHDDFILH